MKKILLRLFLGIPVLLLILGIGLWIILEWHFSKIALGKKVTDSIVLAIPKSSQDVLGVALKAYDGPHPAIIDRSLDTFEYPIEIGQIGPVQALFSGPLQYPFLCGTRDSGLGQPEVDNQQGFGISIYEQDASTQALTTRLKGYSKDCLLPTQISYYYNLVGTDQFKLLTADTVYSDIAQISLKDESIDFIVRVETGTINRFIYTLAALKGPQDSMGELDAQHWNRRLIYQFRGGVGIGRRQGRLKPESVLSRRKALLQRGYALAYSTANQTSNHYNMWLAEEVMMRVKSQFVARYGQPNHTLGIGGSGGAIQQYLIAQNHPGLLDGALTLYSYPDMVTQTIYAYDCELLEYYFDVNALDREKWRTWENRSWIEGLNAKSDFSNRLSPYFTLARVVNGVRPFWASGMSECVNGWRGLTQLTLNPTFTHLAPFYEDKVLEQSRWTHWGDLKTIYGTDALGYGNRIWDNEGVQYGLQALKAGHISVDEFLHLNAKIGGWVEASQFQKEQYWKIVKEASLSKLSPWSHHNMTHSHPSLLSEDAPKPATITLNNGEAVRVATRTKANQKAIKAAYQSGHVFLGKIDIPVIDLRHYMEQDLDMHHLSASFSTRSRIQQYRGDHQPHVMWVTRKPHMPVVQAVEALDAWVTASQANGQLVVGAKPQDTCFDHNGKILAQGPEVWNGDWNNKPEGSCLKVYPAYQTSRIIAGGSWQGSTMKCELQSVRQAIEKGIYYPTNIDAHYKTLVTVFPAGVCDYTKPEPMKQQIIEQLLLTGDLG